VPQLVSKKKKKEGKERDHETRKGRGLILAETETGQGLPVERENGRRLYRGGKREWSLKPFRVQRRRGKR